MKKELICGLAVCLLGLGFQATARTPDYGKEFRSRAEGLWQEIFSDPGRDDWRQRWFKDGDLADVENTPQGMLLKAGPVPYDDAHHLVLWTRQEFSGDLKIEYDFTRIDASDTVRAVNILYIEATGSGEEGYDRDISKWRDLRRKPSMKLYYNHMNTYHISYSVVEPQAREYVRARRYMPGHGLKGSDLTPEYYETGLFRTGVKYHITVIKQGQQLWMNVKNESSDRTFYFDGRNFPPVETGRIGLRLMFTRQSLIGDFKVYRPLPEQNTNNRQNRKISD